MQRLNGGVFRACAHAISKVGHNDDQCHRKDRHQRDDDRLDLVVVILERLTCNSGKRTT